MNFNQKETGEGLNTLPVKGSPLKELSASLGNIASVGFDNLKATQEDAQCGQHPTGGAVLIVAPADAVPPAVGEVQQ